MIKLKATILIAILCTVTMASILPARHVSADTVADGVTWGVDNGQEIYWNMNASGYLGWGGFMNGSGLWRTIISNMANSTSSTFPTALGSSNEFATCFASLEYYDYSMSWWYPTFTTISMVNLTSREAVDAIWSYQLVVLLVVPLVGGVLSTSLVNDAMTAFFAAAGYVSPTANDVTADSVSFEFADGTYWNATYDQKGVATSFHMHFTDALLNAGGYPGSNQFVTRHAVRASFSITSNVGPSLSFFEGSTGNILNWTASGNNTYLANTWYTIYRNGTYISDASWALGTPVIENIDGLPVGTYNFTIVMDGCGRLINSVIVNVRAPAPPGPPVLSPIVPATSTNGSIALSWSSVSGATTYEVYHSQSPITSSLGLYPQVIDIVGTTYVFQVYANGKHYFAVTAVNASGSSDVSNCENVTVNSPAFAWWGVVPGQVFLWSMDASTYLEGQPILNGTGLWNTTILGTGTTSLGAPADPAYNPYQAVTARTGFFNTTSGSWFSVMGESPVSAINISASMAMQAHPYFIMLVTPLDVDVLDTQIVNRSMTGFFSSMGYTTPTVNVVTATSVSFVFPDGTYWNATYDASGVATSYHHHWTNAMINALGLPGTGQFMTRHATRATMSVTSNVGGTVTFPVGTVSPPPLNWTVSSNIVPPARPYTVLVNGSSFMGGTWTPGVPIIIPLAIPGYELDVGVYNFTIVASGLGDVMNTVMVTVVDAPRPPFLAPIAPLTSSTGTIVLNWTGAVNADTYAVYRATTPITSVTGLTPIVTGLTGTTYTDTVTTNGRYYYVVVATNSTTLESSAPSNCVWVKVAIPPVLPLDVTQLFTIGVAGVIGLAAISLVLEAIIKRRK